MAKEKDVNKLVETLSELTVLEMSELKKALEEKWGVKAQAAVAVSAAATAGPTAEAKQESTEFDVILESFQADKKIAIIKAVREISGLGLKEAKDFVESTPKTLKEAASKSEADEMKKQVEAAGGKVSLKGR